MSNSFFYTIVFLFISLSSLSQESGTIDYSFGKNGKVITMQKDAGLFIYTSTTQSDGKILIGGYRGILEVSDSLNEGFLIMRYQENGILDSSFGIDGMAIVKFPGYSSATVKSLAIQSDGKILATGNGIIGFPIGNTNALIVRLKPNGTIDSTFRDAGKYIYDSKQGNDYFDKILIKTSGEILFCGQIAFKAVLFYQLLPTGDIDTKFGNDGVVLDQDKNFNVRDAAFQHDGKIIVGGNYGFGGNYKMYLGRYLPDGDIDESFGSTGKTITNLDGSSEEIWGVGILEDDKIIASGNSGGLFDQIATVVRFSKDGVLDQSFANLGVVNTKYSDGQSSAKDVVIQNDGKILTAVFYHNDISGFGYFATNRYNASGTLDSLYGNGGTTITEVSTHDFPTTINILKNGKILISGNTNFSSLTSAALVRYNGDKEEKIWYVKIKHWLHHHGITWEDKPNNLINYYSIQSSTNGNAFTEVARIFSNHNGGIQAYSAANNATANYRVAAVSNTGNITYSNTLSLVNTTPTIQLYPNPAKNNLQIQGLPAGTTKLTVTDISGNTRIIATANSTVYSINITQLTSGNYLLNIKTANEVITKQFIKE
ncbi:T9SS type A sorting domain-containing protein [Limnovirga soli]|nr:T9SS type A sorting domain-containing protein [Limnovirga soli]